MTDIFPQIYTDIATAARAASPGVYVTGERIPAPAKFPCVVVVEADNYEDPASISNNLKENLTVLMYEITVFSNLESGKRSQCIDLLKVIDTLMKRKNATRTARVEGYFDTERKIYMVTARYQLKTDGTNLYTI